MRFLRIIMISKVLEEVWVGLRLIILLIYNDLKNTGIRRNWRNKLGLRCAKLRASLAGLGLSIFQPINGK